MNTYTIQLRGQVDVDDLNARGPQRITILTSSPSATRISICADQSALVGLLRHLHGLGFVILSVYCQPAEIHQPDEENRTDAPFESEEGR